MIACSFALMLVGMLAMLASVGVGIMTIMKEYNDAKSDRWQRISKIFDLVLVVGCIIVTFGIVMFYNTDNKSIWGLAALVLSITISTVIKLVMISCPSNYDETQSHKSDSKYGKMIDTGNQYLELLWPEVRWQKVICTLAAYAYDFVVVFLLAAANSL